MNNFPSFKSSMKKYRYIYVPLETGVLYSLLNWLILGENNLILWHFIVGSMIGFTILIYNDYRVKKLAPKDFEKALEIRPERNTMLFTNFDKAFDLCLESVGVLRKGKVKKSDKSEGVIVARMGINWNTFGSRFTYKLKKITDLTTEIEIKAEPIISGTRVDYGENYQAIEDLVKFLDQKNLEMNRKHLNEQKDIPADIYISSKFKKEEIPTK